MRTGVFKKFNKAGFTLVELMVAVAIFGIASAAMYATYQQQQNSYLTQEQVADMQQNLRAAMFFVTGDLKKAGYDPSEKAEATLNSNNIARVAECRFAYDENEDGVIQNNEYIRYALTSDGSNGINDSGRDGLRNSLPCHLGRQTGIAPDNSELESVADNVDAIEFLYHLADGTITTNPARPSEIRTMDVSLLVRTGEQIKGYIDRSTYFPASNPGHETGVGKKVWGPFNDPYQRRLLITQIKCRNIGVE
ncbi:MAG: prepilin-type N-terminal cleavage/methylation domain-containing protein [Proteobacteria bacterium]|nr:prepilin-type N-terminal cleavage/methylation domain-containing protein [Pseudomonadota bacterium]